MELPLFEVPADALGGAVREMTASEAAAVNSNGYTAAEVVTVAAMLARVPKFPLDMLDAVLLFADFVVSFEARTQEIRYGRSEMNEVYLELQLPQELDVGLPPGVAIQPTCVDLVVNCASHDQGWASLDNEHDGTYNASFTWSEVAVLKRDGNGQSSEAVRQPITSNVRASRTTRHHVKLFKDPKGLIQHIGLGDTVQIILRSQYPGWANFASYGRLRARFALEICEDANLSKVPLPVGGDRLAGAAGKCLVQ